MIRVAGLIAPLAGVALLVTGCSAPAPEPTPTPTQVAEVESTVPPIESLAELATWTVDGETVTWQLTFGARFGIWTLVGTSDAETQLITGTWSSTSAESGTFEAKQPVR